MKDSIKSRFGIFYTPENIAEFLVKRSLINYFYPAKDDQKYPIEWDIFERYIEQNPVNVQKNLEILRIVDPSVGNGIFLLKMAHFIERIYFILNQIHDCNKYYRENLIKKHLFGWDIQSNAIVETKKKFNDWINAGNKKSKPYLSQEFEKNLELCDSLEKIEDPTTKSFSIVIGNPPYGNILTPNQKKRYKEKYHCRLSEISELFIELGLYLIKYKNHGILTYILPKTIAYYQNWQLSRDLILKENICEILNLGIAFPNVNFEEIALIIENKTDFHRNKCFIFQARPLKLIKKTEFTIEGNIALKIMKRNKIILFSALKSEEMELIEIIRQKCDFLPIFSEEKPFTKALLRSIYISDKEKADLKPGSQYFLNKVPDLGVFVIKKLYKIENLPKYQPFLKPKLLFKVLRGSRLTCYPDIFGNIFTTEKVINFFIDMKWHPYLEGIALILNTRPPSFYLQAILYSNTTESSRVLDNFYAAFIPLPRISNELWNIFTKLARIHIIIQYSAPSIGVKLKNILTLISEFLACWVYFPEIMKSNNLKAIWSNPFCVETRNLWEELMNLLDFNLFQEIYQNILEINSSYPPIHNKRASQNITCIEFPSKFNLIKLEQLLNQIYRILELSEFDSFWLYRILYHFLAK